ncbi:MAG: universal stress protein [Halobacteriota archaeon]
MTERGSDRPVLVGASNPSAVQQLVRTAGDLALLGSGTVRIVTVAVKPPDSPFGVFTDETIVREFATESHELLEEVQAPPEITVERDVIAARTAAKGLLEAVESVDPVALVIGWQGPTSRSDAVLGTTLDTLVERAQCDLYVERVGREADGVDSILLPVAGGPHVAAAARIAAAIAVRNDARVVVFTVADQAADGDQASRFVEEGKTAIEAASGATPSVESSVVRATDVSDAIVEESSGHDIVVMGATRKGSLRRKIAGSVPRTVVERIDGTVILARDSDTVEHSHGLGSSLRR